MAGEEFSAFLGFHDKLTPAVEPYEEKTEFLGKECPLATCCLARIRKTSSFLPRKASSNT